MAVSLPSEKTEFTDARTGARMIQWTSSPQKDQHFYFTSPSVTEDDRWLVFISERTGDPNLFAIDRATGEMQQVSDNTAGLLHAYVYPYGGQTGLSKASPALDAHSGTVVWVQDNAVWTAKLGEGDAPEPARRLADLPGEPKMVSGFTHVSKGGQFACVPVAAPEAFTQTTDSQGSQMGAAFKAFNTLGLESLILIVDLASGEIVDELSMPFWVTHVVFMPNDPTQIVFCQEGGGIIVSQRTWCWQRQAPGVPRSRVGGRPLYPQPASEWMSHENVERTGKFIIAHGGKRGDRGNIGHDEVWFDKRDFNGKLLGRYTTDGTATGHAVMGSDGVTVVMDPKEYLWTWNMETGDTQILCEHGSSMCEQDCHVHPVMTADGNGVVFTSDRAGGVANVYEWRVE
jgi:hypothetical protein